MIESVLKVDGEGSYSLREWNQQLVREHLVESMNYCMLDIRVPAFVAESVRLFLFFLHLQLISLMNVLVLWTQFAV